MISSESETGTDAQQAARLGPHIGDGLRHALDMLEESCASIRAQSRHPR
jgi:hypothetical protein